VIGLLFSKVYSKCTQTRRVGESPQLPYCTTGGRRVGESPQLPYCKSPFMGEELHQSPLFGADFFYTRTVGINLSLIIIFYKYKNKLHMVRTQKLF